MCASLGRLRAANSCAAKKYNISQHISGGFVEQMSRMLGFCEP
jgi:hypothetical protein